MQKQIKQGEIKERGVETGLKINAGLLKPARRCRARCGSVPVAAKSPLISADDRGNMYEPSQGSRAQLGVNKQFQWLLPALTKLLSRLLTERRMFIRTVSGFRCADFIYLFTPPVAHTEKGILAISARVLPARGRELAGGYRALAPARFGCLPSGAALAQLHRNALPTRRHAAPRTPRTEEPPAPRVFPAPRPSSQLGAGEAMMAADCHPSCSGSSRLEQGGAAPCDARYNLGLRTVGDVAPQGGPVGWSFGQE